MHRDFIGRALHGNAAGAGVGVARVLADHDVIDLVRAFVLQRRIDTREELDGTQVDVLIQLEAGLEQDPFLEDARRHVGMTDRAQENRIELPQFFDTTVGQGLARTFIAFATEIEFGQVDFEAKLLGRDL